MNTMLNVKIDRKFKDEAKKLADSMGLTLSAVVNNSLKRFVEEKQVVFSAPLVPNKKTAASLKRIDADVKKGINLSPTFSSVKEMMDYLEK